MATTPRFGVLPVVCDTLKVSFITHPTWQAAQALLFTQERPAVRCRITSAGPGEVTNGNSPSDADEASSWTIRYRPEYSAGKLSWHFEGADALNGVRVSCGDPLPGQPSHRRWTLTLSSARLWRAAGAGINAATLAAEVLASLATCDGPLVPLLGSIPSPAEVLLSRVDLCRDHWGYWWTMTDLDRFVGRSRTHGIHREESDGEIVPPVGAIHSKGLTLTIGARGSHSRMLRIYDKTVEAERSGKLPWLEPIWLAHGWDGHSTVWRAEVEFGRTWLKDHGCGTLADFHSTEDALWSDYVASMRHVPATSGRKRREDSSPIWQALQRLHDPRLSRWIWQPRPLREGSDMHGLLCQALGCLNQAEKCLDSTYTDPHDHIMRLLNQMRKKAAGSVPVIPIPPQDE